MSVILLFIYGLIMMFNPIFFIENPSLRIKVIRILFYIIILIVHMLLYGIRKSDLILYIIITLFIFLEITIPIIFRKGDTIYKKIETDEEIHFKYSIFGKIFRMIGPSCYYLIFIIYIGSIIAFDVGRSKAINQKDYYVMTKNPNIAVIGIYQDILISVPLNMVSKTINGSFLIQKIGEKENIEVMSKNIGPLKYQKDFK